MENVLVKVIAFDHETGIAVESLSRDAKAAKRYAKSLMSFELLIEGAIKPRSTNVGTEVDEIFDTPRFDIAYTIERVSYAKEDHLMNKAALHFADRFEKAFDIACKEVL